MDRVYRDQVLEVEPTGIEFVAAQQRHGSARSLFGLWFSANAEIATWMVGVFAVALYGTSLRGAAIGLIAGNLLGFALLGVLATFGPAYGVPQMVASRLAFGRYANAVPAALSFLAGVGWFAINTVFGAYALQTIVHLPYAAALAVMLAGQIVLAVYGYNLIHRFEALSALLLAGGFALLGFATFARADWHAGFNSHALLAGGGEAGGIVLASALGFSYATGWVPCASDYSRYLPETASRRAIWWYAFLGCVVPCIALEIIGAATVTAVRGTALGDASPTQAIAALLGNTAISTPVLLAVVLGTLTANCMNLYSGAMAALVVHFPRGDRTASLLLGCAFGAATASLFLLAHTGAALAGGLGALVFAVVAAAGTVRMQRWFAAVVVGIIGAAIASGGGHPDETAKVYTNFLLLLSYWASPWAATVLVDHLQRRGLPGDLACLPAVRSGMYAWLLGLAASIPFWNQAWFTGPFAHAYPQFGDLSYYVGFAAAALVMVLFNDARRLART
ncbi:MAG: cytosine permease [Candidatus Baltobacteraceae bacterium]